MSKILNLRFLSLLLILLAGLLGAKGIMLVFKLYPNWSMHNPISHWRKINLQSSPLPPEVAGQNAPKTTIQNLATATPIVVIESQTLTEGRGVSEQRLVNDLRAQIQSQKERQTVLDLKQQTVEALEAKVIEKITELQKLKEEVNLRLEEYNKIQGEKIKSLVSMYESMPSKRAAEILDILELEVVLVILKNMKPFKAAPILANMPPSKVSEISKKYAIGDISL